MVKYLQGRDYMNNEDKLRHKYLVIIFSFVVGIPIILGLGMYIFMNSGEEYDVDADKIEYVREDVTFEEFLNITSINVLGEKINYNRDKPKFVGTTELKKYPGSIGIVLRADTPSDAEDLSMGLLMMHGDILSFLREVIKDEEFNNQKYFGIAFMTEHSDKYGETQSQYILIAKYKLSELQKVKWDNISRNHVVDLAEEYWVTDALVGVTY